MRLNAKVIAGKKYDTRTAEFIGSWENGHPDTDINYVSETLYRTQWGEFFLHGDGGANTSYAKQEGSNSFTSGEAIEVMTPDEALDWAETHDVDVDTISLCFKIIEA